LTNIIDSYNEQPTKNGHKDLRQIYNKTDDVESDYHYCDVMIGGSQSMIGNFSDLHILHGNIYRPPSSLMIDVGHGVLILKIRRMISGELGLLRLENVAVNVFDEPGNIVLIPSEVS